MTIHYTDPSADTRFTPSAHNEVRTNNLSQDNAFRTETASEETIVPVYARKAPKKDNKRLLMVAAPVAVAAIALGAWALMGQGERSGAEETQLAAVEDQSTSRLMAADTAPAAPLAVSEAVTPTPVEPAAAPTPVARAVTPTPRAAPAPVRRAAATPAPARRAAPAARAETAAPAATPITPQPYEPVNITPAPSAAPTPESAAPLVVVPTRTLPAEPTPSVTPPATPESGGGA